MLGSAPGMGAEEARVAYPASSASTSEKTAASRGLLELLSLRIGLVVPPSATSHEFRMPPAVYHYLASRVTSGRAHLAVASYALVLFAALATFGYCGYLPGGQTLWLGTALAVTLIGLLPLTVWLAVALWREQRDLDDRICREITGLAALEQTMDCEGGARCFLNIAGLRLRLSLAADECDALRERMDDGVVTVEYTGHSQIPLRVLDSRGAIIYLHPDCYLAS